MEFQKAKVEGNILINKLIFDDVTRYQHCGICSSLSKFPIELVL